MVKVFGRDYNVPRLTTFVGEEGLSYSYSGFTHNAISWPAWFEPLLERISISFNTKFNGCLINLYRNGNDKMGWHSDDEDEIDSSMPILSLSLGSTREIIFKHKTSLEKHVLSLGDGDILLMKPYSQQSWIHSLPVRKKIITERINLTFRCYI